MLSIDSCLTTFSNLKPLPIIGLSSSSNNFYVNGETFLLFSIPILVKLDTTDHLIFEFSGAYTSIFQFSSVSGRSNGALLNLVQVSSSSSGLTVQSGTDLSAGDTLEINISTLLGPPSTNQLLSCSVAIEQNGYLKATGSLQLTPLPNSISLIQITATSKSLETSTSYSLWYISPDPLTSSSLI